MKTKKLAVLEWFIQGSDKRRGWNPSCRHEIIREGLISQTNWTGDQTIDNRVQVKGNNIWATHAAIILGAIRSIVYCFTGNVCPFFSSLAGIECHSVCQFQIHEKIIVAIGHLLSKADRTSHSGLVTTVWSCALFEMSSPSVKLFSFVIGRRRHH